MRMGADNLMPPRLRRICIPLAISILAVLAAFPSTASAPPWETKDWAQWTMQDCNNILHDSPWALTYAVYRPGPDGQTSSSAATAQISSSRVIRQAMVRRQQLMREGIQSATPQAREQSEKTEAACLSQNLNDRVIVTIESAFPDDFKAGPELEISKRKYLPLQPSQTDPTNPCPNGGYAYLRVVNGKPVIGPGDKKLTIVTPWKRDFEFDIQKMVYKGKPDF
jgi:hypothetical protein